jgi:hypothetical protein
LIIAATLKNFHFTPGADFRTFFPRKVIFSGKFYGICFGNDFSKLFPRTILIFPDIFWGKFSAEFSPEKMYEKSAPGANPTIMSYNGNVVKFTTQLGM